MNILERLGLSASKAQASRRRRLDQPIGVDPTIRRAIDLGAAAELNLVVLSTTGWPSDYDRPPWD